MTLLAPWALWFLALGGAVVALYLLKIKRRQATVPALDFWLALAGRTKVHSLWDRLKRLLSLLLWLLILACLVFALGNPIISLGRIKPRAIVVVMDNSASMQTAEPDEKGTTRLAQARRALGELTTRRPVNDEWLLIEASMQSRVVQPWTFDSAAVRQEAEGIKPFGGAGDLRSAVELASQLLAGKPEPCIVVISDGAAGRIDEITKTDDRIVYWPIGKTKDNLGISKLAVRADRQRSNYQVLIGVVSSSDEKIETQVTLQIDGSSYSVELVSIEPHGTWEKTVIIEPPRAAGASGGGGGSGGVLRASIDRPDALAIDNEAFAILEPIRPAVVWLVTPADSAFFFEQALASMEPLVWAEESLTMTPEKYQLAAASIGAGGGPGATPSPMRTPDLIVFNGWSPPSLPATGHFVLVGSWPKEIAADIAGPLAAPQLFIAPRPHPLTQHITMQGARLTKAQKVTLREPARVLAQSAEGDPLMFLVEQRDRQALCLAFDVLDSDLPFRNAFPLLLRNAVAFMHEDAPSWLRERYRIGESVVPVRALPAGTGKVTLAVQHEGKPQNVELPVRDGQFVFTDTGHAGAVRVRIGEEASYASISLSDAGESHIEPIAAAEDPAKKLVLSGRLFGAMPWVGLAAFAAMAIALEWLTYHFRWTE